jgi:trimethylamine--corrinoid protein Co-methyltransferase
MLMCRSNIALQKTPVFRVLSDSQIEELHFYALEILERVGIEVIHEEALSLLQAAGARIENSLVRISEDMVQKALVTVPSRIVLANRDGQRCMFLEGHRSYFGPGSGCPFVIDPFTGDKRDTTRQDVANTAKLVDFLPNFNFVMDMGLIRHECPQMGYIFSFYEMVTNNRKPIVASCGDGKNCLNIIKMAEAVMGGAQELRKKPLLAIYSETTSPLRHAQDALGKVLICAENWVPIIHTVGTMAGATSPATLAGSLAQANAELLSGLVIHQLKQPGAPFFYGGTMTALDMKTGHHPHAAPEFHLMLSALTQMGQHYKIPVWSAAGCTDAKIFDEQAAGEATYSILISALAGGNLIHDVGYLEGAMISSPYLMVYCDEMIELIKHIVCGIRFDDDELALDIIDKVGPGGNFLAEEHTALHFRRFFNPKIMTRENYHSWKQQGAQTCDQKVAEKTQWILQNHEVEPLNAAKLAELDRLVAGYLKEADLTS